MGIRTSSRVSLTASGSTATQVAKAVAPADPMEMTRDKLIWLFSEEATDYLDEHLQTSEDDLQDEDNNPIKYVIGEDILGFYDNDDEGIAQINLRERFATYLVDAADMNSDEAVEAAEELIDQGFLDTYRDEFIASLKQECADKGITYFYAQDDYDDAVDERFGRFSDTALRIEDPDYFNLSDAVLEAASELGIGSADIEVEELDYFRNRDQDREDGAQRFVRVYVFDDEDGAKSAKLMKSVRAAGYALLDEKCEDEGGTRELCFDLEPWDNSDAEAEEAYERRAAFGEGETLVNVFTGETYTT
jgi:hypothetical protein